MTLSSVRAVLEDHVDAFPIPWLSTVAVRLRGTLLVIIYSVCLSSGTLDTPE
jgi:hypothetical protein